MGTSSGAREEGLKGEVGRMLRKKAKRDMSGRERGGWFSLQDWGGHFLLGTRWYVWAYLERREMDEEGGEPRLLGRTHGLCPKGRGEPQRSWEEGGRGREEMG